MEKWGKIIPKLSLNTHITCSSDNLWTYNMVGKEKSVLPIICVYVTRKFDYSDCTEIWKTWGNFDNSFQILQCGMKLP